MNVTTKLIKESEGTQFKGNWTTFIEAVEQYCPDIEIGLDSVLIPRLQWKEMADQIRYMYEDDQHPIDDVDMTTTELIDFMKDVLKKTNIRKNFTEPNLIELTNE